MLTNPLQRARSHAQMTGSGSGAAEFNPQHHSIRQREKSGLIPVIVRLWAGSNRRSATTETDIRWWWPFDGFAPCYPTCPRLPLCSRDLVDRHLVREAAQRHAAERWL